MVQIFMGGSSGEYCIMGESLMQRRRVRDDGFWVVNLFQQGRSVSDGTCRRSIG